MTSGILPIKPTLIIDSREKTPFDFDDDDSFAGVIHEKLDQADYSLKGLEHIVAIERKANANELYTNLHKKDGRERLYREMERLSKEVKYRFIIIEQDMSDIFAVSSYEVNKLGRNKFSPFMPIAIVLEHLIQFMIQYNVYVIFAGDKGKAFSKKLLLQVYEKYRKGRLSC